MTELSSHVTWCRGDNSAKPWAAVTRIPWGGIEPAAFTAGSTLED